jgi:RimJ/RimL family protein N-acetyltransferase
MSILEALQADSYRIGNLQAIIYDRRKTEIFRADFLSQLYFEFLQNRYNRRPGTGILEMMLCGFEDFSHDSVVGFWLKTPLVILGVWHEGEFKAAGLCFPAIMIGAGQPERACYGGYAFKPAYWGTDEQEVLATLGIAALFQEMQLLALHGSRFETNDLTAKFMQRFGFRDVATLPAQMTRKGKLVSAVISTLPREVFEAYLERQLSPANL